MPYPDATGTINLSASIGIETIIGPEAMEELKASDGTESVSLVPVVEKPRDVGKMLAIQAWWSVSRTGIEPVTC